VTAEPLPAPPDDPAKLIAFPMVPEDRVPELLYHIHRVGHEPDHFDDTPEHRFNPPPG